MRFVPKICPLVIVFVITVARQESTTMGAVFAFVAKANNCITSLAQRARPKILGKHGLMHPRHSSPFLLAKNQSSSPSTSPWPTSSLRYRRDDSNSDGGSTPAIRTSIMGQMAVGFGIAAQPVVWISLYTVATTGAGLPAGPYGLLGAVEGLSYLAVLGWAGASFLRTQQTDDDDGGGGGDRRRLAMNGSRLTLVAALATLAALAVDRGCVPNARPILDYSAYLPVCGSAGDLGR